MLRKLLKVTTAGLLGLLAVVFAQSGTITAEEKKDEKKKTSKEIMAAAHKGDDALAAKITLAVKDGKWEEAQKLAKQLAEGGALLPKASPSRGDAKSWEDLAAKYATNTKAVSDAAEKKDGDAAKSALETLNASCKTCHMAHKGKK